jgi:hypothetical protein
LICCFHSFFLKPLSVTLPFAARFTYGKTTGRARKRIEKSAKAKTVTVAKGQKGDAGAVFDLVPKSRPGIEPVSNKRWGGGVRKKGEDKQPDFVSRQGRGVYSARSLREISTKWLQSLSRALPED